MFYCINVPHLHHPFYGFRFCVCSVTGQDCSGQWDLESLNGLTLSHCWVGISCGEAGRHWSRGREAQLLGGSCGWECREAFYRRLGYGSVGKDLLHDPQQWFSMEEKVLASKLFIDCSS